MSKKLIIILSIVLLIILTLGIILIVRRRKIRKLFQGGKSWMGYGIKRVIEAQNPEALTANQKSKVDFFFQNSPEFAVNLQSDILRIINLAHKQGGLDLSTFVETNSVGLAPSFSHIAFNKFPGLEDTTIKTYYDAVINEHGVKAAMHEGGYKENAVRKAVNWERPEYLNN